MKKSILVVDDDFLIRELLKFKLSRQGFDVVTASSEKEFWDKTFVRKPDLIILDIRLQKKNGFSAYQNMVDFVGFDPHVPVIFITAYPEKALLPTHREGVNYAVVPKPFDFEDLGKVVKGMLAVSENKNFRKRERRHLVGNEN